MGAPVTSDELARSRKAARTAVKKNEPLIVTGKRVSAADIGPAGKSKYYPGEIVFSPTDEEVTFLEGFSDTVTSWFGGPLSDPPRVEGRLYPQLLQRGNDRALLVRMRSDFVQLLAEAPRREAVEAVRRCADPALLQRVEDTTSEQAARSVAQAKLEGRDVPGPEIVQLAMGEELSGAVVVRADGTEVSAAELYADELAPFAADCDDPAVFRWLQANGISPQVKSLADQRLAELGGNLPEPGTKGEPKPAAPTAMVLALSGDGRASVASGEKLSPASEYTVDDLKPAVEACSDVAILGALYEQDERKGVQIAAGTRIGELQGLRLVDGQLLLTEQLITTPASEASIATLRPFIEAEERSEVLEALAADERKGVQQLVAERLEQLTAPAEEGQ